MIIGTLLFITIAFLQPITWIHGLILLGALSFVLFDSARDARGHRRKCAEENALDDIEEADPEMSWLMIGFYILLGMIGLPLGADLLVDSSVEIARKFHVSETVIGLTLVAIGTSLPELATTVMAALRRQADVALGNVIGSNMFNLLAVIGVASLVGPIPVVGSILSFDVWIMLGASLMLFPFVFLGWDLNRKWGAIFCALYASYILVIIT